MASTDRAADVWPPLAYAELKDTLHAVHMWTQVVGKIRLALTPLMNHWWNSTLLVTPRGLTTLLMPTGGGALQIDFDFLDHELVVVTSRGGRATIPLRPMSVADFYRQVQEALAQLGCVFDRFRADFLGKASPVQFFWGGFDLASARFSGRRGPAMRAGARRTCTSMSCTRPIHTS